MHSLSLIALAGVIVSGMPRWLPSFTQYVRSKLKKENTFWPFFILGCGGPLKNGRRVR